MRELTKADFEAAFEYMQGKLECEACGQIVAEDDAPEGVCMSCLDKAEDQGQAGADAKAKVQVGARLAYCSKDNRDEVIIRVDGQDTVLSVAEAKVALAGIQWALRNLGQ